MSDFNPNSIDAQLATILSRLKQQDRTTIKVAEDLKQAAAVMHEQNSRALAEILIQAKTTNGRVTRLESGRKYFMGYVAGVSGFAALAWVFFVHFTRS